MTVLEQVRSGYEVATDEATVWQQANRVAGNMVPGLSENWQENLTRAVSHLGAFTAANQVVRMKPPREQTDFIDLSTVEVSTTQTEPMLTEGMITTNPDYILHANPADCGEIAVHGISKSREVVIGLFHASRALADRRAYIDGLEYMCNTYGIAPEDLKARLSPSARAESYALEYMDEAQKSSRRWRDYMRRDNAGLWHVDVHGRTMQDLIEFGVSPDSLQASPDDTAAPESPYYSNYRSYHNGLEPGGNGLFFALRS